MISPKNSFKLVRPKTTKTNKATGPWIKRTLSWLKHHKLKTFVLSLLAFPFILFGTYYVVDTIQARKNLNDLERIKTAFVQLEKDVEVATGEDLHIFGECHTSGKFGPYTCDVLLANTDKSPVSDKFVDTIQEGMLANTLKDFPKCGLAYDRGYINSPIGNHYGCDVRVHHRNSSAADRIFQSI